MKNHSQDRYGADTVNYLGAHMCKDSCSFYIKRLTCPSSQSLVYKGLINPWGAVFHGASHGLRVNCHLSFSTDSSSDEEKQPKKKPASAKPATPKPAQAKKAKSSSSSDSDSESSESDEEKTVKSKVGAEGD